MWPGVAIMYYRVTVLHAVRNVMTRARISFEGHMPIASLFNQVIFLIKYLTSLKGSSLVAGDDKYSELNDIEVF